MNSFQDRQPISRRALNRAKRLLSAGSRFDSSAQYWEERYRRGGNSGAGSYNRLAAFKAEVLNEFVSANQIQTVIEFGSGDGAQLALAQYPNYTGVDISPTVIEATRLKFAGDSTKRFILDTDITDADRADLALSLDVIYHLVEDDVFDKYMSALFSSAIKYVIVYSSNYERAWDSAHVRHREFTRWVEENRPDFKLQEHIPNRFPYNADSPDETSFADFYVFAASGQATRNAHS